MKSKPKFDETSLLQKNVSDFASQAHGQKLESCDFNELEFKLQLFKASETIFIKKEVWKIDEKKTPW